MHVPISYMEDGTDPGFIGRVRRELAELRQNRHARNHARGAAEQRFDPHPPIPEPELAALEAGHGIRLPADYRAFLTRVGDGGAGPWQGLLPVREAIRQSLEGSPGGLTEPFPHGRAYEPPEGRHRWFQFSNPHKRAYVPFSPDEALSPAFVAGSLILSHGRPVRGGATRYRLVLTGPERGRVWWDHRAGAGALGPCEEPSSNLFHAGFREWMLTWLQDCRIGVRFGL